MSVSIETVRSADYEPGARPCAICGRALRTGIRPHIHVIDGGSNFEQPGDPIDEDGDLGWFPIGPECSKQAKAHNLTILWMDA